MTRRKYYQASDREWIAVPRRGFKEQCCDCGLVHKLNFRIVDGQIQVQAIRDSRATNGARKHFKFTPDED